MSKSQGRLPTPTPNIVVLHHLRLFRVTWGGYKGNREACVLAASMEEAIDGFKPHVEPICALEIEGAVFIHKGKKDHYHQMIDGAD